jgi:hypothetical protein
MINPNLLKSDTLDYEEMNKTLEYINHLYHAAQTLIRVNSEGSSNSSWVKTVESLINGIVEKVNNSVGLTAVLGWMVKNKSIDYVSACYRMKAVSLIIAVESRAVVTALDANMLDIVMNPETGFYTVSLMSSKNLSGRHTKPVYQNRAPTRSQDKKPAAAQKGGADAEIQKFTSQKASGAQPKAPSAHRADASLQKRSTDNHGDRTGDRAGAVAGDRHDTRMSSADYTAAELNAIVDEHESRHTGPWEKVQSKRRQKKPEIIDQATCERILNGLSDDEHVHPTPFLDAALKAMQAPAAVNSSPLSPVSHVSALLKRESSTSGKSSPCWSEDQDDNEISDYIAPIVSPKAAKKKPAPAPAAAKKASAKKSEE